MIWIRVLACHAMSWIREMVWSGFEMIWIRVLLWSVLQSSNGLLLMWLVMNPRSGMLLMGTCYEVASRNGLECYEMNTRSDMT